MIRRPSTSDLLFVGAARTILHALALTAAVYGGALGIVCAAILLTLMGPRVE